MFHHFVESSVPDRTRNDPHVSMTRGGRIRAAARTLRTSRTASWVTNETEVSVKTVQKYLDQLVEDNVLRKTRQGDQTLYHVDQPMATYHEVAALQREHSREELTSAFDPMRSKITGWKQSYDVETPDELRASIADLNGADEAGTWRGVASKWEYLADRIPVVRATLNEYDWATKRDSISA